LLVVVVYNKISRCVLCLWIINSLDQYKRRFHINYCVVNCDTIHIHTRFNSEEF